MRTILLVAATALVAILSWDQALAQATRTWVSGVGDDANPCSRTAPCKTFAGAISKTATGGEINCIDPGGFGALTITKSISIQCEFTEGGVLVAGTNGITVNTPAGSTVMLRGLDILGAGTGLSGINFIQAGVLHVEKCIIRGFNTSPALGINFAPSGNSELYVSETSVSENGTESTGGGILIRPTGTAVVRSVVRGSRIDNNANGFTQDGTATSGTLRATFWNSVAAGNTGNGIAALGGAGLNRIMVDRSTAANNGVGLFASAANGAILVTNSSVSGNNTGLSISGGHLFTYKTNSVNGNVTTDGAFTDTVTPE